MCISKMVKQLISDEKAVAATEFALLFPVMITLVLGISVLGHLLLLDRKLTSATMTAGDLVAQEFILSEEEMNNFFDAMDIILQPYDPLKAGYVVASVNLDESSNPVVGWSRSRRATAVSAGSLVDIPDGMLNTGDSVIVTNSSYDYSPLFASNLTGPFEINDQAFFRPRRSRVIDEPQ